MKKLFAVVALLTATLLSHAQTGGINIENNTGVDLHVGVQFTSSPCVPSASDDVDFDLLIGDDQTVNFAVPLGLFRVGVIYGATEYVIYSPCLPGCGSSMPAAPFTIAWDYSPDCMWFKLILT